jgi:hypothetical protein
MGSSVGGPPFAIQYAVFHSEQFPPIPMAFICRTAFGDVSHSVRCPVSTLCGMGPMSESFNCFVLRDAGAQTAAASATIARSYLMFARNDEKEVQKFLSSNNFKHMMMAISVEMCSMM